MTREGPAVDEGARVAVRERAVARTNREWILPHEAAGMVGRIVVGRPGGPGTLPFDHFTGQPGTRDWRPVPPAAQTVFPRIEAIVKQQSARQTPTGLPV